MRGLALIHITPDAGPNAGRTIWHFLGRVPAELARTCSANDPAMLAEYDATARQCGPGFARRAAERNGHTYGARVFHTRAEAMAAAAECGATVTE